MRRRRRQRLRWKHGAEASQRRLCGILHPCDERCRGLQWNHELDAASRLLERSAILHPGAERRRGLQRIHDRRGDRAAPLLCILTIHAANELPVRRGGIKVAYRIHRGVQLPRDDAIRQCGSC